MGQTTLGGRDLSELRARYRAVIDEELPAAADPGWPIRDDHCFARIVLDDLFGGVWYDHVDGRPAYEQLSAAELTEAIATAERLLDEGRPAVVELNEQSLRWRTSGE